MNYNFKQIASQTSRLAELEIMLEEKRAQLLETVKENGQRPLWKRIFDAGDFKAKRDAIRSELAAIGAEKGKIGTDINQARKAHYEDVYGREMPKYQEHINQEELNAIQLGHTLEEPLRLRRKIGDVINMVDRAKSSINSASDMEVLDLFTKNKGIAFMSTLETSSANTKVQEVKRAVKSLQADLKGFKPDKLDNLSYKLDFVTDMMGVGFDFMSLFALDELSDAQRKLSNLKRELESVKRPFDKVSDTLTTAHVRARLVKEDYLVKIQVKADREFDSEVEKCLNLNKNAGIGR